LNNNLVILAGGKGSRLGREKAWVKLNGQTLLERSIDKLGLLGKKIIIVRAPGQKLPPFDITKDIEIITDVYPGKGPLVGIYSGLVAGGADTSFVIACDMPFVNVDLARYMISLGSDFDVVVPEYNNFLEPLHAVYSGRCVDVIRDLISSEEYKVDRLLDSVKVRYVKEDELSRFDPERLSFFNINKLQDLQKAEEIAYRLKN